MFGVEAFPAAAFFVLLFLTPDSPRWLVARGPARRGAAVLRTLGTDTDSVETEISEIQASLDLASPQPGASRFSDEDIAGRSCWRWRSPCSTSFRASTR